ncbi:MAG TPA: SEC-C metal-binding domain-containing protein [Gammaproteobacteria bacterium]
MARGVGRNERCPCGSGKKYKRCCALKTQRKMSVQSWLLMSVIALMLLAGAVIGLSSLDEIGERSAPGRVWHGDHWH